jgi:hypothetical protein
MALQLMKLKIDASTSTDVVPTDTRFFMSRQLIQLQVRP